VPTPTTSAVEYTIYPNPATNEVFIDVRDLPREDGEIVIYDGLGKIVDRMEVKLGHTYNFDLSNYGPGIFYTKVISGYSGKTQKMIIMK